MNARAVFAIGALACASAHEGRRTPSADATAVSVAADAGVAEDAPCATDADCGLTNVAPGACCPMLCTPRVVTRNRAQELEARLPACGRRGNLCPQPLCRPPLRSIVPVCEAGRCVAHVGDIN